MRSRLLLLIPVLALLVWAALELSGDPAQKVGIGPAGSTATEERPADTQALQEPGRDAPAQEPEPESGRRQVIDTGADEDAQGLVPVQGAVKDPEGRPVAGVVVRLVARADGNGEPVTRPGRHQLGSSERSGPDGSFALREPLAPGTYQLTMSSRQDDLTLVNPIEGRFEVEAGQERAELSLVVTTVPAEWIRGQVLDPEGKPLEGAVVFARWEFLSETTDPEGRFALRRSRELYSGHADLVPVGVKPGEGHAGLPPGDPVAWGTDDLVLRVGVESGCVLEVVSAVSGEPIEEFGWVPFQLPQRKDLIQIMNLRDRGRHEDGKLAIGPISDGRVTLIVWPSDPRWSISPLQEIDVPRGRQVHHRVVLQESIPVEVRVVDGSRAPVRGARVRLGRVPAQAWKPGRKLTLYDLSTVSVGGALDQISLAVGEGVTDADGRVVMHAPAGDAILVVEAEAEGHPVIQERLPAGARSFELVLPTSAEIFGRCKPIELIEELKPGHGKALDNPGMQRQLNTHCLNVIAVGKGVTRSVPVGADGSFGIGGLPAGGYELQVNYFLTGHGVKGAWVRHRIQQVELAEGERKEVEVDLTPLLPVPVDLRVRINGLPLANGTLQLQRMKPPDEHGWRIPEYDKLLVSTDAEGRCLLGSLPPGTWQGEVRVTDASPSKGRLLMYADELGLWFPDLLEIERGRPARLDVDVVRRAVTLRVVEADGVTPARGRAVKLFANLRLQHLTTLDDNGELLVDPAPPIPFKVQLWAPAKDPYPLEPGAGPRPLSGREARPQGGGKQCGPFDPATFTPGHVIRLVAPKDGD
ncbi:MAG: hypothetical protein R3F30_05870 [Planctomycetota bacterium]